MKKKLLLIALVLMVSVTMAFAEGLDSSDSAGLGAVVNKIFPVLAGAIPGAILFIKFLWDIVAAYISKDQDPTKLQKSIIKFLICVGIIVLYFTVITQLFGTGSSDSVNTGNFIAGLKGAVIASEYMI